MFMFTVVTTVAATIMTMMTVSVSAVQLPSALQVMAVGSMITAAALPPSCSTVSVNGITYQQCGSTWYQPQYSGSQVNYIVVNPPR